MTEQCHVCDDVRKRLKGFPESRLDGYGGLAEAVMNSLTAREKEFAAHAVECDALLSDLIEQIAPYDWQLGAKQSVDKLPPDQLEDAWHWTATYLVELRARISADNEKAHLPGPL